MGPDEEQDAERPELITPEEALHNAEQYVSRSLTKNDFFGFGSPPDYLGKMTVAPEKAHLWNVKASAGGDFEATIDGVKLVAGDRMVFDLKVGDGPPREAFVELLTAPSSFDPDDAVISAPLGNAVISPNSGNLIYSNNTANSWSAINKICDQQGHTFAEEYCRYEDGTIITKCSECDTRLAIQPFNGRFTAIMVRSLMKAALADRDSEELFEQLREVIKALEHDVLEMEDVLCLAQTAVMSIEEHLTGGTPTAGSSSPSPDAPSA